MYSVRVWSCWVNKLQKEWNTKLIKRNAFTWCLFCCGNASPYDYSISIHNTHSLQLKNETTQSNNI